MEDKNNVSNTLKIILVVLLLIAVGVICYLLGSNNTDENSQNKENNVTEENNLDNADDKQDDSVIKELDLSQCLNTDYIYKNYSVNEGDYGLSMSINSDQASITLSIDWSKFGPLSAASAWGNSVENYQIIGFTKNIVSTFIGDIGQSSMGITLFYLMDDGTVEYTPMFELKYDSQGNSYYELNYTYEYSADGRVSGQHFESKGVINGVDNVIKLYNVDTYNSSNGFGMRTTIGAKADGSFYDLGDVIMR